tara:strand:+ start:504 stop:686 length:183 start_codon:yes stop_codon:yes gene_type:complete
MVDYTEKEKDWEQYNQHGLNIDMANTLVSIKDVLETQQKMIEILAKYVGMPVEIFNNEEE